MNDKMSVERMKKAAKIAKSLIPFYDEDIFGWNGREASVQMGPDTLLNVFPDAEITTRADNTYPYVCSVMLDGVKFFGLMSQGEYDELVGS